MQRYGDTTLDGESLDSSITEKINKCTELKELLDDAIESQNRGK